MPKTLKKRCSRQDKAQECYMNQITKKGKQHFIVSKNKSGRKYWKKISAKEKNCRNTLKKNISKYMKQYKKKDRVYHPKQAIAISYSQLFKKKPECKKVI